ncbi:PAS domain-containing protein [Shewanella seohaensis]|uniref:PDC sensor domain-containing protein n=1 Tax=Shewanella seohaensis TaxID=755175 RepID=UPI00200EB77A|nr:PAS domain-containing protein [Shewanella seohaensis]MCL1121327.1 PAS domain-containing protein [Shewanella seohaensis]UXM81157.1 PAS domain-containing protein [Shewanella seohaensis]
MDKRPLIEPQAPLTHWQKSLPFKLSLIQLLIASILIFSTAWVILNIQTQQISEQQTLLNQNHGQIIIAKLQEMTSQVENQVNAISQIAMLYRYEPEQLSKSIPVLLSIENQKAIISGGGIWPEPGAFDRQKFRDSLFWSHNIHGELVAINSYNDDSFPSYHTEEWYRPTRYFPVGKIFWSKSYVDPTTHEPMVTASGAMWMDHQFIGAATTDISLEKLNQLLRNTMLDVSGYVIALDHQNQILASPNSDNLPQSSHSTTHALQDFDELAKTETAFSPIASALHLADRSFIEQAVAERVFTQEQMDNLTRLSNDGERQMLSAIVNDNAKNQFLTPRRIASVSLTMDPILKGPSLVSVFLMPHTYWKILVVTPIAPLQDTAKKLIEKVGLSLVLIQMLGLILLFLLQHRLIIAPIMEMVQALKRNDSASIELKAKERHDEVGLLAKSFLSRTQQLEVAMASLDASNLALEQQLLTQQHFQQELNQRKEQLRSLLDFSSTIIYIKDLNGRYTLVNNKYCEVLGIERRKIIGATDFDLFQNSLAQQYQQNDQRVTHSHDALHFEEAIPSLRGEVIYQMSKFDIRDDEDNSMGVGAIGFNVDLKKRQEKEQEKLLQSQLAQLKDEQRKTQLSQQENSQLREQLAAIQAEINQQIQLNLSKQQSQKLMQNFLADVMSQMMQEQDKLLAQICQVRHKDDDSHQAQVVQLMSQQAARLRHISQLFTDQHSEIRPLHLAQFINQLLSLLQPQLLKTQVKVKLECDEQLVVDGNAWQYLQFFYRLINNTLHHAFKEHIQNRTLALTLEKKDGEFQMQLKDNGVGISVAHLEQLKQEMQQNQCIGTLTCINLWIKEELHGELKVESELNRGTLIECHWPLAAV